MTFVHDDPEFDALIRIVSAERRLTPALVEKDYWVTHCMWALHQTGLDLWFKGGTSLSKVYRLIERFSEDIDLVLDWRVLTSDDPMAKRSRTQQEKLNVTRDALGKKYLMIGALKQGIAIYANDPAWAKVRPPLVELTADQAKSLEAELKAIGFTMPGIKPL